VASAFSWSYAICGPVFINNTVITNFAGLSATSSALITSAGANEILDNATAGVTPTLEGQQ
jgi:hypothetical protein